MSEAIHTVVGILPSTKSVQDVIDGLEAGGFDRSQFGMLAPKNALSGAAETSAAALAGDPHTPTDAAFEPESEAALSGALVGGLAYLGAAAAAGAVILAGGPLGLALVAFIGAGGAGGLVGALVAQGFHHEHAQMIDDQLASGGLVLWITPRDAAQESAAKAKLENAGAKSVTVQTS